MNRYAIPTQLTQGNPGPFRLYYLEVNNNTGGSISFAAYDSQGLCVIPEQDIGAGVMMTYECRVGAPVNGLFWIAGSEGLIGWFSAQGTV